MDAKTYIEDVVKQVDSIIEKQTADLEKSKSVLTEIENIAFHHESKNIDDSRALVEVLKVTGVLPDEMEV